jgi:hypothetical protein
MSPNVRGHEATLCVARFAHPKSRFAFLWRKTDARLVNNKGLLSDHRDFADGESL